MNDRIKKVDGKTNQPFYSLECVQPCPHSVQKNFVKYIIIKIFFGNKKGVIFLIFLINTKGRFYYLKHLEL